MSQAFKRYSQLIFLLFTHANIQPIFFFACLDKFISSFETLHGLCCAACLRAHPAPVSSPISQYVNTRRKLGGSKRQSPSRFPFYLFIELEAYLKREILEMSEPGNLINLRDVVNRLAVNDI